MMRFDVAVRPLRVTFRRGLWVRLDDIVDQYIENVEINDEMYLS